MRELRSPIPLPCLTLVTDRHHCQERNLEQVVAQAVEGGVTLVQLREKDLPGGPLLELAQQLRTVTRGKALLFVNERVDVALACGADGVHLPEEGLPAEAVRALAGDRLLIGRSVHSVEGAVRAEREGVHFVQAGTIFPTRSKPEALAAGPQLIRDITQRVNIPVLAIGGIVVGNAHQVIHAGAHGVAVIGAIMDHGDPQEAARALRQVLADAWNLHPQPVR